MADNRKGKPLDYLQQHASISLQFMLSEFLMVAPEIEAISVAVNQLEAEETQAEEIATISLSSLKHALGALLGIPVQHHPFTVNSWSQESGRLRKFYHHSYELVHPEETNLATLRLAAGEALHSLSRAQLALLGPTTSGLAAISSSCRQALSELETVAQTLPSLLTAFNREENVLFFLLRHREQLDALYTSGFVRDLFLEMFSEGPSRAEAFLVERYQARGFHHLLAHISTCMATLR